MIELVAIPALVVLVGFLIYHFSVRTIRNPRPAGGENVLVTRGADQGSELSFAEGPGRRGVLFGTTDSLVVWSSRDGGRTWRRSARPRGVCGFGWPRALAAPDGREILGFLAEKPCGERLTPFLVVTSRSGPAARWSRAVRVAPPTWKWGFDDAPSLAVDPRSGRLYAAWSRNLDARRTTVVTSASDDGGRTWTAPRPVSAALVDPHRAAVAVGPDGAVDVAGIDVRFGLWVARSTDGGRTFGAPRRAARLRANPARWCGLTGLTPLPNELRTCAGPDPTLLVDGDRVLVVYDDAGPNGTQDVFVAALDSRLRPVFRTRVSPPDRGKTDQYLPAAGVDAETGAIWACWYDTTFDPHGHRSWFTCSASRTGRTWTAPVRAAAAPSLTEDVLYVAYETGLYPSIVAARGVAHVFWADTRVIDNGVDAYTAALSERAAFAQAAGRG
ncbi:MAG TPA: sialidase family protein [Gaiellaceae bacterium]|nr:sialidase family protein [Gaiellaceae bacterium]